MNKIIISAVFALCVVSVSFSQPRPADQSSSKVSVKPAPESFTAKYEGGMLGYSTKETGTLRFDDPNNRLVFFGKAGKEVFPIPYEVLVAIYPQSQSVTSTTGNVVSHIPLPGAGLAGFIKEKRQYLIVQYDDPSADIKGTINFKLDNKEILDSVLQTLAEKANLKQRGDAYYRPKIVKVGT